MATIRRDAPTGSTAAESAERSVAPRSLAEDLRLRDDAALSALLVARPDLLSQVPGDLGQLAARASSAPSVHRALDRLNRFELQVVETLVLLPDPASPAEVAELLAAEAEPLAGGEEPERVNGHVAATVTRLRELALVWGTDDALHLTGAAREILGAEPAGLAPPYAVLLAGAPAARLKALLDDAGVSAPADAASVGAALVARFSAPGAVDALLAGGPAAAREVLDQLTWGPPYGSVARAHRDGPRSEATTPIEWLLATGLLVAPQPDRVALPQELALILRGGRLYRANEATPPKPKPLDRDPKQVDRTAGAAAFDATRKIEDLLEAWSVAPPPVLRSGGVAIRDLRAAARLLDVDESTAALHIETAYVAGLLASDGGIEESWLPTPLYDIWSAREVAARWGVLAQAWLASTRVAGLVGTRDDKDRPINALGPELERVVAPELRRALLVDLAQVPVGSAIDPDTLEQRQAWRHPRRAARSRGELVAWTLREAETLGILGRGALSAHGRALFDGMVAQAPPAEPEASVAVAAKLLEPLLPRPVSEVLIQGDLTAVAPGPLDGPVARELALMADIESTGGATVYRFSETSVRRALDAGRSASDLQQFLGAHSSTAVPQPLRYLVDDVARRHGRVRIGGAAAYVRSDDTATLDELVADRRTALLRLRRLAPTVAVALAAPDVVLDRLRALGFAPAAESFEGDIRIRRPDSRRTPPRQRPPRLVAEAPAPRAAVVDAAVRAMRAGDKTVGRRGAMVTGPAGTASLPRVATAQTISVLQGAVDAAQTVWLGYVDGHGAVVERAVDPIRVDRGYLTAYDQRNQEVRTFAVHRITGVAALR